MLFAQDDGVRWVGIQMLYTSDIRYRCIGWTDTETIDSEMEERLRL